MSNENELPAGMDEERAALLKMMEIAVNDGVAFIMPLMPVIARQSPEALEKTRMVVEQQMIRALEEAPGLEPVLRDIIDAGPRAEYPWLRMIILEPARKPDGNPDFEAPKIEGPSVQVPKGLLEGQPRISIQHIFGLATVLGFLTYPAMRALLGAHGLDCVFEQSKVPKAPPVPKAPVNPPKSPLVHP